LHITFLHLQFILYSVHKGDVCVLEFTIVVVLLVNDIIC